MATWQFDASLLPAHEIVMAGDGSASSISAEQFDAFDWWSTGQPPPDLPDRLTMLFGEGPRAIPGGSSWGSETGNRVDVGTREDGRVDEIWFRLDAREVDGRLVEGIADLAAQLGCMIRVADDGSLLRPEARLILEALDASLAARFVRDPKAALGSLPRPDPDWWK